MKLEQIFEQLDFITLDEGRTPRRTKVIRKGKMVKKKQCAAGYRLQDGRCVRQKAQERRARTKGARKGNRVSKAQRKRSQKRSNRIRKRRGL